MTSELIRSTQPVVLHLKRGTRNNLKLDHFAISHSHSCKSLLLNSLLPRCLEGSLNVAVVVVVDVETEVYPSVKEEEAAVTLNSKHLPPALKAIEAVEVARMEAVVVEVDEAVVVQRKGKFSREKPRHAFVYTKRLILEFCQPW